MKFELLETVVLVEDLSEHRLQQGDLGTIVELYESGDVEVEFVTAAGETQAVITLSQDKIRKIQPSDIIAVRSLQHTV